jgi:hypothetical protein
MVEMMRDFAYDLWHLPVIFRLFLLYAAGAWLWNWWKRQQQEEVLAASASWPVYRARVVWAQVLDRQGGGEDGPSYWEGLLTYSYTVPGQELEIGEHRKRFDDEEDANDWARALRDTYVDVRVDPADAKRSVWQKTEIVIAPTLRAPVMDAMGSKWDAMGQRQMAATAVFCAAALGAIYAGWIQFSCLGGKPLITAEKNTKIFFGMHLGAMLCAIVSGILAGKNRGRIGQRLWRNRLSRESSNSLGLKVVGAYAGVVFTYGWVRMAAHDGDSSGWGILMFSAGWLLFYLTAALSSWRTMQGSEQDAS